MAGPFEVKDVDGLDTKGKVLLLTRRDSQSHMQLNGIVRKAIRNMGDIDDAQIVASHATNVTPDYDGVGKISTQQLRDAQAVVVDIPSSDLPLCADICKGLQAAGIGRRLFFVTGNPMEIKDFFETGLGKDFGFHPDVSRDEEVGSPFHIVEAGHWPKGKQALDVIAQDDLPMNEAILDPSTVRMVNDTRGIVIYDKSASLSSDLAAGVSALYHLSDEQIAQLEHGGSLTPAQREAFERRFDAMTQQTSQADGSGHASPKTDIDTDGAAIDGMSNPLIKNDRSL